MTLLEERPLAHAETRYGRWAWIAIATTPVGLAVAVVGSFAGEGSGSSVVGGALIAILCLVAPSAAVCFAGAAIHAQERGGRNALAVAVPILGFTIVLLPLIAIGVAGWLVGLAIDAFAIGGYFAWRYCR